MTAQLIAVVPERIRRRWDAIALQQVCEATVLLSEQNEELDRRVYWAEQCEDMWRRTAEIEREHGIVGLTIDGQIVRLDQGVGATIDDDPEYRRSAQ